MILQLKIQIESISKPPVWRKVLVPANFSFARLHLIIQNAFGWGNYHLYMFSPKGYGSYPIIGLPNEEWDDEETYNSEKVKLSDILTKKGMTFKYIYDFGDDWIHKITVEDIIVDKRATKASLIGGKGACPPEDCGGVWGYYQLLETIDNPSHPDYSDMREWLGLEEEDVWDRSAFDKEQAEEDVAAV